MPLPPFGGGEYISIYSYDHRENWSLSAFQAFAKANPDGAAKLLHHAYARFETSPEQIHSLSHSSYWGDPDLGFIREERWRLRVYREDVDTLSRYLYLKNLKRDLVEAQKTINRAPEISLTYCFLCHSYESFNLKFAFEAGGAVPRWLGGLISSHIGEHGFHKLDYYRKHFREQPRFEPSLTNSIELTAELRRDTLERVRGYSAVTDWFDLTRELLGTIVWFELQDIKDRKLAKLEEELAQTVSPKLLEYEIV